MKGQFYKAENKDYPPGLFCHLFLLVQLYVVYGVSRFYYAILIFSVFPFTEDIFSPWF
ncbi:hypothetical protein [Empedobacter brevis]|uniref:hypothetical protein n=1 Tax=Empedobacter brevis TaxID=247 RepID=UPI0028998E1E|nr:hypothetical protein [Empedobacter brevis]